MATTIKSSEIGGNQLEILGHDSLNVYSVRLNGYFLGNYVRNIEEAEVTFTVIEKALKKVKE